MTNLYKCIVCNKEVNYGHYLHLKKMCSDCYKEKYDDLLEVTDSSVKFKTKHYGKPKNMRGTKIRTIKVNFPEDTYLEKVVDNYSRLLAKFTAERIYKEYPKDVADRMMEIYKEYSCLLDSGLSKEDAILKLKNKYD